MVRINVVRMDGGEALPELNLDPILRVRDLRCQVAAAADLKLWSVSLMHGGEVLDDSLTLADAGCGPERTDFTMVVNEEPFELRVCERSAAGETDVVLHNQSSRDKVSCTARVFGAGRVLGEFHGDVAPGHARVLSTIFRGFYGRRDRYTMGSSECSAGADLDDGWEIVAPRDDDMVASCDYWDGEQHQCGPNFLHELPFGDEAWVITAGLRDAGSKPVVSWTLSVNRNEPVRVRLVASEGAANEKLARIRVLRMDGQALPELELDPSLRVHDLRGQAAAAADLKLWSVSLLHGGDVLDDALTLAGAGFGPERTDLTMVVTEALFEVRVSERDAGETDVVFHNRSSRDAVSCTARVVGEGCVLGEFHEDVFPGREEVLSTIFRGFFGRRDRYTMGSSENSAGADPNDGWKILAPPDNDMVANCGWWAADDERQRSGPNFLHELPFADEAWVITAGLRDAGSRPVVSWALSVQQDEPVRVRLLANEGAVDEHLARIRVLRMDGGVTLPELKLDPSLRVRDLRGQVAAAADLKLWSVSLLRGGEVLDDSLTLADAGCGPERTDLAMVVTEAPFEVRVSESGAFDDTDVVFLNLSMDTVSCTARVFGAGRALGEFHDDVPPGSEKVLSTIFRGFFGRLDRYTMGSSELSSGINPVDGWTILAPPDNDMVANCGWWLSGDERQRSGPNFLHELPFGDEAWVITAGLRDAGSKPVVSWTLAVHPDEPVRVRPGAVGCSGTTTQRPAKQATACQPAKQSAKRGPASGCCAWMGTIFRIMKMTHP